jgi:hypothetical protein
MLSKDRRGLDSGLKDAGYDLTTYSVTVAPPEARAAVATATPTFSSSGAADPSLAGGQGSASQQQATGANGGGTARDRGQPQSFQQQDQNAASQRPSNPNGVNNGSRQSQIYV